MARLLDSVSGDQAPAYPPYNIEKTGEDAYRITMAVAGFGEEDLDVTVHDNQLTITGKQAKKDGEEDGRFLYRGIAERAFERRFSLAAYLQVAGARLNNGLLHVELVREDRKSGGEGTEGASSV